MTVRRWRGGKAVRASQTCQLCGNTKRAHRSVLAEPCPGCGRTVCARHARSVAGRTLCTHCVRDLPPDQRRTAMRVAV